MRQSKLFARTKRSLPKDLEAVSHKLLVRGDFIESHAAGIFSLLPLGMRVYQKIEDQIRRAMNELDAQEILMPTLQPKELWVRSGRWTTYTPPLFITQDRHDRQYALGPTHEEIVTVLASTRLESWRNLPSAVYQIQNKFRNELRATAGLLRAREFMMKDLYSFHADGRDLRRFYERVEVAYRKLYRELDLKVLEVRALSGPMGGAYSHEYMVTSPTGEDRAVVCDNCGYAANIEAIAKDKRGKCPECAKPTQEEAAIECGHTFELGTKYSESFNLMFSDSKGAKHPIQMGCYGIGLGRLMATLVETHHDEHGIVWPASAAPFHAHLLLLGADDERRSLRASRLYQMLQKLGVEVLFDDREVSAGEKLKDADLIGIPYRLVVSSRTNNKGKIELCERSTSHTRMLTEHELARFLVRTLPLHATH